MVGKVGVSVGDCNVLQSQVTSRESGLKYRFREGYPKTPTFGPRLVTRDSRLAILVYYFQI
jgi:hypothetical protein